MRRSHRILTLIPIAAVALGACVTDTDNSESAPSSTPAAGEPADSNEAAQPSESSNSSDDDGGGSASSPAAADVPQPTSCDDVASSFATSGSANNELPDPEVEAVCEGDSIVVTSNGIPDYTYIETSPGSPAAADLTFTLPADPQPADETTAIPLLGTAAVAVNGVPIYGPTEGTGGDVLSLAGALSECGSHNGPTGFHMHLLGTSDSTDCLFTPSEVAEEPQLLGYALDGFPIYTGNDQYTSSWVLTDESLFATDTWAAHTYVDGAGDLDECNGMTDAAGDYAYYTTDAFPYVLGCYTGDVDLDAAGGGGGGPGGPPPGA